VQEKMKRICERPYLQHGVIPVSPFIKLPEARKQAIEDMKNGDEEALAVLEDLYYGSSTSNFHPDELRVMKTLIRKYRREFVKGP